MENGQQILIEEGQFSIGTNGAVVLTKAALAQLTHALTALAVQGVAVA